MNFRWTVSFKQHFFVLSSLLQQCHRQWMKQPEGSFLANNFWLLPHSNTFPLSHHFHFHFYYTLAGCGWRLLAPPRSAPQTLGTGWSRSRNSAAILCIFACSATTI